MACCLSIVDKASKNDRANYIADKIADQSFYCTLSNYISRDSRRVRIASIFVIREGYYQNPITITIHSRLIAIVNTHLNRLQAGKICRNDLRIREKKKATLVLTKNFVAL
jgi:hypothetical protein